MGLLPQELVVGKIDTVARRQIEVGHRNSGASICTDERPHWIRAISRAAGSSIQPDSVSLRATSSGRRKPGSSARPQRCWRGSKGTGTRAVRPPARSLAALVMVIHRLDPDPPGPVRRARYIELPPKNHSRA